MAILSYNEIVQKKIIVYNNEPYKVLSSHVFRINTETGEYVERVEKA